MLLTNKSCPFYVFAGLAVFNLASVAVAQQHDAVIDQFCAAFNAHNPAKMASMVTDDFALYYVSQDGEVELATSGPAALEREMAGYFKGLPTVTSRLDQRCEVGNYISFRETASWVSNNGDQKSQTSLAVYQMAGGKIQRVWYYPAQ